MDTVDQRLEASFGAIERRVAGLAQIKTVVLVIANGGVPRVGAAGRRSINCPIPGHEDIGGAVFDGLVGVLEVLENRRGGNVLGVRAPRRQPASQGQQNKQALGTAQDRIQATRPRNSHGALIATLSTSTETAKIAYLFGGCERKPISEAPGRHGV